ncbi:winged-helix domain-containing protein [Halodesulfurarchaeum sp. HSR-GB]|nr:winged-helix domain-containing protein [Halodesulfurarchaeum sp. HSR-GB]MDR5657303.1 winged-helix domain-containing protein [Halodesulfurarchaeum sp. HSR-GB]
MSDSVILDFLYEKDLELPPKALYRNLNRHGQEIGYSTVQLRLNELLEHDFVTRDGDGYYEITNKGKMWVEGKLSESDFGG